MFLSLPVEFFFGLGILAKALFEILKHTQEKYFWPRFVGGILLSTYLSFQFYFEDRYEPASWPHFALLFFIIFAIYCIVMWRKHILVEVNELVLLVWNTGLVYLHIKYLGLESPLTMILLAPTLFTLSIAFLRIRLTFVAEVFLYLWFMIMGIIVSMALIPWREIFDRSLHYTGSAAEMFFLGMALFYALSYIVYLGYFFPLSSGKSGDFTRRFNGIKKHALMLSEKFHDTQFHPMTSLLVILLLTAGLLANNFYNVLSENLLLALLFSLSPWIGEHYDSWMHAKLKKV